MQLDELFHQCEADAQSFAHDAQPVVGLFEHVEYLGLLTGWYADAVVGYFDDREAIGFRNLDSDVTTFGRIARRITDYVADDLNKTRRIHLKSDGIVRCLDGQAVIGSDDGRLRKLQGGRQHLVEADVLLSQQYLAAFDTVYVEQIVHEAGDMVEVLPH